MLAPALLVTVLVTAVWYDLRSRRIPNGVVFVGMVCALALHSLLPPGFVLAETFPVGIGLLDSLAGLGVGLALMLPLYMVRATGAGDVKLMAMVGAFIGPVGAVGAVVCTFVAGAVLSVLYALRAGVARQAARNIRLIFYAAFARLAAAQGPVFDARTDSVARMPYALAIAVGTFAYLSLRLFA